MSNTADVVKVGDKLRVKVLTVDPKTNRLALTMKGMGRKGAGAAAAGGSAASYAEDDNEGEAEALTVEDDEAFFEGNFFK